MGNITIKQIAERAQVSRGTVDRVLNGRPDVSDKTRAKVLKIIEELDYKPNVVAKALKSKEKKIKIGIVVSPKSNFYGKDVLKGVLYAQKECLSYGVTVDIYEMDDFSGTAQQEQIRRAVADHVDALALAPMETAGVKKILTDIVGSIPLVFYNTQLRDIKNLCYIGQDARACGRVAAQLLGMISQGGGGTVVFLGYQMIRAHMERFEGFRDHLSAYFPQMRMIGSFETQEDPERIKTLCRELFAGYDIKNIFISGGDINALGDHLIDHGLVGKVNVVCTDYICRTPEFLKNNVVQFAIGQQPFEQGYYAVKVLKDHLLTGIGPKGHLIHTNLDIFIKENIDFHLSEGLTAF